jgi:hypothetical protein
VPRHVLAFFKSFSIHNLTIRTVRRWPKDLEQTLKILERLFDILSAFARLSVRVRNVRGGPRQRNKGVELFLTMTERRAKWASVHGSYPFCRHRN